MKTSQHTLLASAGRAPQHSPARGLAIVAFCFLAAGCTSGGGQLPEDDTTPSESPEAPSGQEPGNASGGEDNTYDHPDSNVDPFDVLVRMQEEGPARYTSRVHSCPKMKYATIGRLLESRGVNLSTTGETEAGFMWSSSDQALGAPNYLARSRESLELTTASASKLFDIFVQAAPEIIAGLADRAECTVGGVGARMFNDAGQCSADGITCLIGVPATAGHLELCNEMIERASTEEKGRVIAVAALAAAAHTCE